MFGGKMDEAQIEKNLMLTAKVHFALGDYTSALDELESLYRENEDPQTLWKIGMCYELLGDGALTVQDKKDYYTSAATYQEDALVQIISRNGKVSARRKLEGLEAQITELKRIFEQADSEL